jgi:capsid protein
MAGATENPFEAQASRYKTLLEQEQSLNERAMRLRVKRDHEKAELDKISERVKEAYGVSDIFEFRNTLSKKKEENESILSEIEKQHKEFEKTLSEIEADLEKIGV